MVEVFSKKIRLNEPIFIGIKYPMVRKDPLRIQVECYAGYRGDERPVRFKMGSQTFDVQEVLDRWYDPQDTYFKVLAGDGHHYILRHCCRGREEFWTLDAFRRN